MTPEEPDDDMEPGDAFSALRRAWRIEWALLIVLLGLAAWSRFTGLAWGLPNAHRDFSYHTDETVIMSHSNSSFGSVNLFSDQLFAYVLPHFYNYGSFHLYLTNIVTSIASGYGYIGSMFTPAADFDPKQIARFYLVGRCLTAVMGVGTVWAVWATARRLWGIPAAVFAAMALATMPLHVQHSHFLTVDVPATFWITLSLYWSSRVLKDPDLFGKTPGLGEDDYGDPVPSRFRLARPWVMAGLFAGLAMATKYNAALAVLPLLVAGHFRRKDDFAGALRGTITGVCAFIAAFVAGCPGSVFETRVFLKDIAFESNHVYRHGEPAFQHMGPGWIVIVTHNLLAGMGLPMLVLSLIAVGLAIWRRKPEDMMLAAFVAPYYLLIGSAQSLYARYDIPMLPVLALWLGAMAHQALAASRTPKERWAITAFGLVVILFTNSLSIALIAPMMRPDPRDMALGQLGDVHQHSYGFATTPWFYTPPIDPLFNLPGPGQWIRYQHKWDIQHLQYNPAKQFDINVLRIGKPDIVLLSEFEYAAPLRLGDPDARAFVAQLRSDYEAPIVVGTPTAYVRAMRVDGLPVQDLPYDMLYTNPQTLIFVRKSAK